VTEDLMNPNGTTKLKSVSPQTSHIVKYIRDYDLEAYQKAGWRCTYYAERGDNYSCFIASWICCK
jgi:hypothetical protein